MGFNHKKESERHHMHRTPTHTSWVQMRARCNSKTHHAYHRYGGRGITVHPRWDDFRNFLADMGERPPGMSLDRYPNNDGNYEPGNVRWANMRQQGNNRSDCHMISYKGRTLNIAQWAKELGLPHGTLRKRIAHGWSIERMMETPKLR